MTVESLTLITNTDLLSSVKRSLGISGNFQDDTLQIYIDEVKQYLIGAGTPADVVGSTLAVGVICRGVADLWNYGNSDTELSSYFMWRAEQLRRIEVASSE